MSVSNGHRPKPRDYRCRNCGRLLFRANLPPGAYVEIRCTRSTCGRMSIIRPETYPADSLVDELDIEQEFVYTEGNSPAADAASSVPNANPERQ